jgi:hypothetical protein
MPRWRNDPAWNQRRRAVSKRLEPNFDIHCYYCHGYGYVERIGGGARIKCIPCDGSGRAEDWRAWQEAQEETTHGPHR